MTATRRLATAAGLALPVVALAYLAIDLWQVWRVPSQADYAAASEIVREGWAEGDVLAFSPSWAHEGAPAFDGLDVALGETTDWYELGKRPRVWTIGSLGRRDPVPPEGWVRLQRADAGMVTVSLFRPGGRGVLAYDFRERLRDARVTRRHPGKPETCGSFQEDRWNCGAPHGSLYVGRRRVDAGALVRDVIWAHPLDKGIATEIAYPAAPRGGTLVVHWGLTQRAIDSEKPGLPVVFRATVDGEEVLLAVVGADDAGWYEREVEIAPGEGAAEVAFTVSSADNRERQFVFTADLWRKDGGGEEPGL
jgi:hypothetical protein